MAVSPVELKHLIADEFQQEDGLIYLNHAAVSPWPYRTQLAVQSFAEENRIYGAAKYSDWINKEKELRDQLKTLINAHSTDEIALLKNTSEALSVVAFGLDWKPGQNIVSTDEEFPSNRIVWQVLEKQGVEFREVNIRDCPDPEQALITACDRNTQVMTISSVQFGAGFRLNIERLGQFCRKKHIYYCVDAIQSIGAHSFDVQAIHADFAMADGHKWMLGPEGLAVFYCRDELRDVLELHQFGWHMVEDHNNYDTKDWQIAHSARRFECGSPNMLGIHALSASLSLIIEIGMETIEKNLLKNSSYLIEKLRVNNVIELLTPVDAKRRAGIVTFKIKGHDAGEIHRKLIKNKVICAYRCGGIRFSPHFYTSQAKIDNVLEILRSLSP